MNKTVIGIGGLTGTQTLDTPTLPITHTSQVVAANASWVQETGTLQLHLVPDATIHAQDLVTFSFSLRNPARAHSSGAVSVWATSQSPDRTPATVTEGGNVTLASKAMMVRGAGYRAPILVANILTSHIAQSSVAQSARHCVPTSSFYTSAAPVCPITPTPHGGRSMCESGCSINTISVSFALNVPLLAGARLTLEGLRGSIDTGSLHVPVHAVVRTPSLSLAAVHMSGMAAEDVAEAEFLEWNSSILSNFSQESEVWGETGSWNASNGSLVLEVQRDTQQWALYTVQVDLINPYQSHDAVNVTMLITSAVVHIPTSHVQMSPHTGANGGGGGGGGARAVNSAPLLVTGFTVRNISQQTPSPAHNNTITLVLAAHTLLPRGDVIILRYAHVSTTNTS